MVYRCFVFMCLLHLVISEIATITEYQGYAAQRPCAKNCFYLGAYAGPDNLADHMGCQMSNAQNECICRSDLQVLGERYVRTCVISSCSSNAADINAATSIYNAYCTDAGFTRDAAVTYSGTLDNPPTTVTVLRTVVQTMTVSSGQKRLRTPFEALAAGLRA